MMTTMNANLARRVARGAALAGLVLCALAALILPAGPASAHAVLLRSSPPADSVLATAPGQVVLEFSEPVRLVPDKIRVIAPDGQRTEAGEPTADGSKVTVALKPGGQRGTYLVSYRVISADSHPVAGGFTYSVGAPSATAGGVAETDDVDPFVRAAIPVAKYLGYAGLVLLVGPALVLALLWPQRLSRRAPGRLIWTGVALIGVSTVAGVLLQAPYTTGTSLGDMTADDLRQVLGSQFGTAHLVRLVVLAGAGLLLVPLLRGASGTADRVMLAVLGVVLIGTWPVAGHPAGSPVPAVSVVVDAIHLGSMAVWLGGLAMLVGFLLRLADERELGAILPIWSRWATLAVVALVLAGTTQALIEVGTLDALFSTRYGRLILTKVGLFAAVVAVAAYSRGLVQRRLAAERPGRLRRVVGVELGITAIVLALTAVLVQTTPARTAEANESAPAVDLPFSTTASTSLFTVQVDVDPAKVGRNDVHLFAYKADGATPQAVVEWQARVAQPTAGVEPIDVPLLKLTDNHATGQFSVPSAGKWELRLTLRISDIDQASVTVTVPIT
jgi:copper transport protein